MGDADNADYKESNIEIFDTVDEVKVTAIAVSYTHLTLPTT